MVFTDLWNPAQNVVEHSIALFLSELDGSVGVDGGVDEVELGLVNGVRYFVSEAFNNDIYKSVGFHLSILDHLKETSPNEGSTQDIVDVMEVLFEVCKGNLVNHVFGKSVVLEVEKDSLVVVGSIVESLIVHLGLNQSLNNINGFVCLEKSDLDSVRSESGVFLGICGLNDSDFGLLALGLRIPECLNLVQ